MGRSDSTAGSLQQGPLIKGKSLNFPLRSSAPCVLIITQNTSRGRHMSTKLADIFIQIFTEIEQNHDCFIDDSDYSSPIFWWEPVVYNRITLTHCPLLPRWKNIGYQRDRNQKSNSWLVPCYYPTPSYIITSSSLFIRTSIFNAQWRLQSCVWCSVEDMIHHNPHF